MEKIKSLDLYQKGILLFMAVMTLVFAAVYHITISREGFEYKDEILTPSIENGNTVYSGKIKGQKACFTVSGDKTVVFQHGEKTYGPYTAKEAPEAIPKNEEMAEYMTGVELRRGEFILFRGGVFAYGGDLWLYNENGTPVYGGAVPEKSGYEDDPTEPSVFVILDLMNGPELTHKGEWFAWFGAVLVCVLNTIFILFADELFRRKLKFEIRNADQAEPSEWEIAERYIGWTVLTIGALIIFIMGLK